MGRIISLNQFELKIVGALIFLFFISGCNRNSFKEAGPARVKVQNVQVKIVPFKNIVVGQTVSNAKVDIKARITGFIEALKFKYGSIVKKGEVLYIIEKAIYEAEVKKDDAKLKEQIITLQNDKVDYERQLDLVKKDAVAVRDYDKARTAFLTSQAGVMSAEADLKIAKTNLKYCTITSPITGKIGISKYTAGNLVSPDSGTLVDIVQMDPMMVEFNPDEALYLSNAPKSDEMKNIIVKIQLSNNRIYNQIGHIDYVNNKVDPGTGTIQFRAAFPNPDNFLLPGQYVKVILEKKTKTPSVVIPQAAVLTGQVGEYVFILGKGNIVEVRKIVTGNTVGTDIVVTSGLKEGDMIVVEGIQKIREGQTVVPEKNIVEKKEEKKKKDNERQIGHEASGNVNKLKTEEK